MGDVIDTLDGLGLAKQETTQGGPSPEDGWPVTYYGGRIDAERVEWLAALEAVTEHDPVAINEHHEQALVTIPDELVALSTVRNTDDGEVYLHAFVYATEDDFLRGVESQRAQPSEQG